MNALNTITELHDAQLEVITLKDLDQAVVLVEKERRAKRIVCREKINISKKTLARTLVRV
jgi:DNA-binding transcriptional regulator YiaG